MDNENEVVNGRIAADRLVDLLPKVGGCRFLTVKEILLSFTASVSRFGTLSDLSKNLHLALCMIWDLGQLEIERAGDERKEIDDNLTIFYVRWHAYMILMMIFRCLPSDNWWECIANWILWSSDGECSHSNVIYVDRTDWDYCQRVTLSQPDVAAWIYRLCALKQCLVVKSSHVSVHLQLFSQMQYISQASEVERLCHYYVHLQLLSLSAVWNVIVLWSFISPALLYFYNIEDFDFDCRRIKRDACP